MGYIQSTYFVCMYIRTCAYHLLLGLRRTELLHFIISGKKKCDEKHICFLSPAYHGQATMCSSVAFRGVYLTSICIRTDWQERKTLRQDTTVTNLPNQLKHPASCKCACMDVFEHRRMDGFQTRPAHFESVLVTSSCRMLFCFFFFTSYALIKLA